MVREVLSARVDGRRHACLSRTRQLSYIRSLQCHNKLYVGTYYKLNTVRYVFQVCKMRTTCDGNHVPHCDALFVEANRRRFRITASALVSHKRHCQSRDRENYGYPSLCEPSVKGSAHIEANNTSSPPLTTFNAMDPIGDSYSVPW